MAILGELYALSMAYPIVAIVIAIILFFIGLKVAGTLLKWGLWILAILAVLAAVYMFVFM